MMSSEFYLTLNLMKLSCLSAWMLPCAGLQIHFDANVNEAHQPGAASLGQLAGLQAMVERRQSN